MMSVKYIPTKDVAKLIRAALRTQFPGVKFSVRCGTGTGSAWIRVGYTDGPRECDVREITDRYRGAQFNGMTDMYDDLGTQLVMFEGDDMPTEVRYICDGVNTSRAISPAARDWALEQIRAARKNHAMVWQATADGSDEIRSGDVLHFNGRGVPHYGSTIHASDIAERFSPLAGYAELVAHQFDLTQIGAPA